MSDASSTFESYESDSHMADSRNFYSLVDGSLVRDGLKFNVINPATQGTVGTAIVPGAKVLQQAIDAADRAFVTWRAERWTVRSGLLLALADVIRKNVEELARLLTLEQGKPLQQARNETISCAEFLEHCSGLELRPIVLNNKPEAYAEQFFVPYGIVAGIVPWNFPLEAAISKIGPAIITGNSIIIKPAPTTPLTTLRFGELIRDVVPAGLIQIIADDGSLGPQLVSHPSIAKISFTGSTASGKAVMTSAAQGLKRLSLELGGNDPAIVFDDVDRKSVAQAIFNAAFLNSGQVCTAIKRVYVHAAIADRFCECLAALARNAVVGDGLDDNVTVGPLQNKAQFDKVLQYLDEAEKVGRIVAGGKAPALAGYFINPTIVTDISDEASLVKDEQFGPILPVLTFTDVDDVVRRANATPYGLTASVWSADRDRAARIARRLDFGTIWVNKHLEFNLDYPFSPCKESGFGTEGGIEGLKEYAQPRLLS
ncbi:aldehyde dehydrogenase family protein (plasmid) [Mesorhizobium sp. AR07]|uniref:aldehyde dehydrogenase family protein n=1 Tax=Mesorhizobium sp. AR07 TaxID=2865838 RepID=UPI00216020EF|nr:aldehyde dehydrogenase family protein [Mesorhizobium sp. AR07]UVK48339.1 aldehyde dehydrogenase family protein [Mesorhizobium sp. AR07]